MEGGDDKHPRTVRARKAAAIGAEHFHITRKGSAVAVSALWVVPCCMLTLLYITVDHEHCT